MVKSGPNRNLNYGVFVFSRLLASNDHLSRNIFGSTPENLSTGLCYTSFKRKTYHTRTKNLFGNDFLKTEYNGIMDVSRKKAVKSTVMQIIQNTLLFRRTTVVFNCFDPYNTFPGLDSSKLKHFRLQNQENKDKMLNNCYFLRF